VAPCRRGVVHGRNFAEEIIRRAPHLGQPREATPPFTAHALAPP
jgi:hypothetical protein